MLLFLGGVYARRWLGREDLSLSLSSSPAPRLLSSLWLVAGWADSLIHGNITGYFPGVENETISNLDITQRQIRLFVCVWARTCAPLRACVWPRTVRSWSSEAICG